MRSRIPEFVGVFVSPFHFRDRGQEMWSTVRDASALLTDSCLKLLEGADYDDDNNSGCTSSSSEEREQEVQHSSQSQQMSASSRSIRICQQEPGQPADMQVLLRTVMLYIPVCGEDGSIVEGGYDFLHEFAQVLAEEQQVQSWKVTLMQKTIGGPDATNGAKILTSGRLRQSLLRKVMDEVTTVIQHLQTLTWPEERLSGLGPARAEHSKLSKSKDVAATSKTTDMFCGSAIRKNFMPETGRFAKLREFGENFRDGFLMLTPQERFPATFLGALLKPGVALDHMFSPPCPSHSALDKVEDSWLDLLQHATSFEPDSPATDCIWTCGLTDAGLHNTFLCPERGLELFDLGKPQIMPAPAFLTKFLFSFFHAFGMEEPEDTNDGKSESTWVRRFEVVGGKLTLTQSTKDLLPYMFESFNRTVDHFVTKIFHNDGSVRSLLTKYVVLQLLSDGAFCLLRWEQKGGGKERFGKRARVSLDKWLWRCLWDLYIAAEVYERLLAVQ